MNWMNYKRAFTWLFICFLLAGCGFDPSAFKPLTPTPEPSTATPLPTEVDTSDCFYAKGSSDLPEIAQNVRQALAKTEVAIVEVAAWGNGQNYVCPTAGKSTFTSNQINLTITIKADDLQNTSALGQLAGKVMDGLASIPESLAPGWQEGQTRFIFKQNDQTRELVFQGSYAITIHNQGLMGEQFWQALNQQPCTSQETSDSQPDLSSTLQTNLENSGVRNVKVNAIVNGISCVDPSNGSIASFAIQNTDLEFSFQINDLNDSKTIGDLAFESLNALFSIPPESIPGPQPASIKLSFQSGDQQKNFNIDFNSAADAHKRGLKGSELYDILTIVQ